MNRSPEVFAEFPLTPGQLKVLGPIIESANRRARLGVRFCVIAQVDLLPGPGHYDSAKIRARLVDGQGFQTVKRALVRAGIVKATK